mgnify:CR=1 FL=1
MEMKRKFLMKSFKESLSQDAPDPQLSTILKSLWYDAKGDWKRAHDFVDQLPGSDAAWVHAYLHRKEGDVWNNWYDGSGMGHWWN